MVQPKFQFTVELKPTLGARHATRFPDDNSIGIKLVQKDKKTNRYELRIFVSEAVAKKAQMKMGGLVMAQLSDCSKALRVLWTDAKSPQFKGYSMRPQGTWQGVDKRKKLEGQIMSFNAIIAVPASKINTTKTKPFEVQYVKVLDARKGQFTVDINGIGLYSVSTK